MRNVTARILLIEDDERIRKELLDALRASGFDVDVSVLARHARLAMEREYDLILLDLGLHDGDGLDLCRDLRARGRSAQTSNHYLKSAKTFTRWLVRNRRAPTDALAHLSKLNVNSDRRHDRRPLCEEEFSRLLDAARNGKRIESIPGADRVMMYTLASWTGFRKGEIGSLTLRSLDLDGDPPTATVEACYSKRRREDTQVLHPELADQLRVWLATKIRKPTDLLFPVSGRVPGGTDRKTHKMMEKDLAAARADWIEEASTSKERAQREQSTAVLYPAALQRSFLLGTVRHP